VVHQLQVGLVYQGRGVEGVVSLPPQSLAVGQLPQFLVHEGEQLVERIPPPVADAGKQLRDGGIARGRGRRVVRQQGPG